MDRKAVCHWARVAVAPALLRDRTPVRALKVPIIFPMVAGTLVKARTSWPVWKAPVIATEPELNVALSESFTVIAASTTTGMDVTLFPSVNAVTPPLVVTTGGLFAITVFEKVPVQTSPSAIVMVKVRAPRFVVKISLAVVSLAPFSMAVKLVNDQPETAFSVKV